MCIALRNLELKKFNPNGDRSPFSVGAGPGPRRTRRDPLRSETDHAAYRARVRRFDDSDSDLYDSNARWDRHRASMPKPVRMRMPRMAEGGVERGDYSGYSGDWHGHLGYSTPGQGRRRSKLGGIRRTGPQRPAFSAGHLARYGKR